MTLVSKDGIVFKRFFLASRCWVVEVVEVGMREGVKGVVCAGLGWFVQGLGGFWQKAPVTRAEACVEVIMDHSISGSNSPGRGAHYSRC